MNENDYLNSTDESGRFQLYLSRFSDEDVVETGQMYLSHCDVHSHSCLFLQGPNRDQYKESNRTLLHHLSFCTFLIALHRLREFFPTSFSERSLEVTLYAG